MAGSTSAPAFALQANFVDGAGLIICVAFHHTVFDGRSIVVLMRDLAEFIRTTAAPETVEADANALVRCEHASIVSDPPALFPEYCFEGIASLPSPSTNAVSRILTFSAAKLAALKQEVSRYVNSDGESGSFASTVDCLGGLIWAVVMRARSARVCQQATARWCIAIDARDRLGLPREYLGNAVFHTVSTAQVNELATEDPGPSMATIAKAASRIRQAVLAVDAEYIQQRLALFASLPDPTIVADALKARLDRSNTGLDFSDWREQGADFDYDIPGVVREKPDWVRKTWSAYEGAVNIMPRQGGARGENANWEVLIALSTADMDAVCQELETGGWIERFVQ